MELALLDNSGTVFPVVFATIKDFLRPVYSTNLRLSRCHHVAGEGEPLTVQFPEAVLEMIHRVIPENATRIPYDLSQILVLLEDTKPEIVSDRRFYRLRELEQSV